MTVLDEHQVSTIKQYLELIETIDEGLQYVLDSFLDVRKTAGNQVLADAIMALTHLTHTNIQLVRWFEQDEELLNAITSFQAVIETAELLYEDIENLQMKQGILSVQLYPALKEWSSRIDRALRIHVQS